MNTAAPVFTAWLDDFFTSYYRHRPVNATFIGMHEHDSRLPDFSEDGAGDALADAESLLGRLRDLPPEPLSRAEWIDRALAEGFLRIQAWEYRSNHFHRGNPSLYAGEAIFGVMALLLSDFAPLSDRIDPAAERMAAIPRLLAQGQTNVRRAPRAWTERALRECRGALAFLTEGVDRLIADTTAAGTHAHTSLPPPAESAFRAAAGEAAAAFVVFRDYLEGELLQHSTDGYVCGPEAFDLYMRQGHFLDMDAAEVAAYGEEALATAEAYLAAHAADFGVMLLEGAASAVAGNEAKQPPWQQVLEGLAQIHPTGENYYRRFTELWQAARETAVAHRLLTWPDFPIEYVPQPTWARSAAPDLYFLPYRSPAAFNRPPLHRYLVPPLDRDLPAAEQEKRLRAINESVIKLNHVVHHGGIGHHVQNWHAYRAASRIGQVAAVDCASRIAMFCGGTMAEGWACYATDLIAETGFLTPLEHYSEYHTRLRMASRAIVDVKLHTGQFGLDEAAAFYQARAGMGAEAARAEAVKNSMFPGAAMMYLVGTDMIHALRRELAAQEEDAFDLAGFHDRFLSYGSIPVSLICAEMRRIPYVHH